MKIIQKTADKLLNSAGVLCAWVYGAVQRKRLKNEDFSILASNCVGGIIYHRLGRQFLSPTIDLWMLQKDFLQFVLNLRWYLQQELVFVQDPDRDYPVARLADITLYFTHYKTEEHARHCWNRRKERINYDNLYIVMYDRDGITEEDILKLKDYPCRGKVVFSTRRHEGIDYVHTMQPQNPADVQCTEKDRFGIWCFEKRFDYVRFLNRGSDGK